MMMGSYRWVIAFLAVILGYVSFEPSTGHTGERRSSQAPPVLWSSPGNLAARDLRWGPGSARLAPVAPYVFIEEDKSGESPKFKVRDRNGVVWTVKLGPESQTETVASRIVWAAGYFAEESYYLPRARIRNLQRLSRGQQYVLGKETVKGARFEPRRDNIERGDNWDWNKNPFVGTRELDGLKVLMVLLNNYDARAENNRILTVKNRTANRREARYVVTDLGATLGRVGGRGERRSKNNLKDFVSSGFVREVEDGVVKFDYHTRPTGLGALSIVYFPYYLGEVKKEKDMRGIRVENAIWIGALLSRLSNNQLRQAFEAADYDRDIVTGYVAALRQRIGQLTRLRLR